MSEDIREEIAAARAAFNDPDKKAAWDQFIGTTPPSSRTNRLRQAFDVGWAAGVVAGLNAKEQ